MNQFNVRRTTNQGGKKTTYKWRNKCGRRTSSDKIHSTYDHNNKKKKLDIY